MLDVFFFKQKTAYEMRISDWSSDVCSSDLRSFEPYSKLPRLQFDWEQPILGNWLVAGLKSEAVAFSHPVKADALRLDLRPYLQLDLEGASWYMRPQIAYRYTAYSLEIGRAHV